MEGTQAGGAARFSCPPNFAAMPPAPDPPRFSLETLTAPDTELWLIQAPSDFVPHCLNGRRVPLSGSQVVKGKLEGKRHRYRVLCSSGPQTGEATLLAPSAEAGGALACAPAPHGRLRITESLRESLPGASLQPIPASLPPQIPTGLRPRFSAFGGRPPVTGPGSASEVRSPTSGKRKKRRQVPETSATQVAVNGHTAMEVDTVGGALEMDKGKKKQQQVGEVEVTEPRAETAEALGMPSPPTTSKKKKKSKGAEATPPEPRMLEPEEKPGEPNPVVETMPPNGATASPSKKKKKQKGAGWLEHSEGATGDSQSQLTVEATMPPSPEKKRRKEKQQHPVVEPGTETTESEMDLHGELPGELGLQAEAVLASPKKKKKERKKGQDVMLAAGTGTSEASLLADLESPVLPAPTEEKGQTVADSGTEGAEARAAPESTKKKKKKRNQGSGGSDTAPQGQLLEPESGKMSPIEGREKKRKRKLQQDPA